MGEAVYVLGTPVIRFQWFLVGGEQWCCWFQSRHVIAQWAWGLGPSTGDLNPPMRSQTHLVAAGRSRLRSTGWVNVRGGGSVVPPAGLVSLVATNLRWAHAQNGGE